MADPYRVPERFGHCEGTKKDPEPGGSGSFLGVWGPYLEASSTATATATVAPTMGLLPMPMRPIIST